MLALLFLTALASAELLKLDFQTVTSRENNNVYRPKQLELPIRNQIFYQVSRCSLSYYSVMILAC